MRALLDIGPIRSVCVSSADTRRVWVFSLAANTHYLEDSVRSRGPNLAVDSARKLGRKKERDEGSFNGGGRALSEREDGCGIISG